VTTDGACLLDTNVVSELARSRPQPEVAAFLAQAPRLSVSVMLFHELAFGAAAVSDPEQANRLALFYRDIQKRFGPTVLPVSLEIASTAGRLRAFAKLKGRVLTVADSLMAATAMTHGLTLATRNVKDFQGLSVPLIDPCNL
jgi:predicted nucleic acid-binding protein